MKNFKTTLAAVLACLAVSTSLNPPVFAADPGTAQWASDNCADWTLYKKEASQAINAKTGGHGKAKPYTDIRTMADCNLEASETGLMDTATTIINVIVSIVGVIAVAVIVIGGILFVTSAGDTTKTKRAQHAIIYGVVGLVVALLAFAIVNFVLKSVF